MRKQIYKLFVALKEVEPDHPKLFGTGIDVYSI